MENYTRKEVRVNGNVFHYNFKGQFHRLDGPACEWVDGDKEWYVNGKRHRLDGPATIWFGENKLWYLKNNVYTKHHHNRLVLFFILEPLRIDLNPE
jgi:hypothetical protein